MLLPQALAILVLALVAAGCAPTDSPLPVGDRATPTPTPTQAEEARAAAAATPTPTWVPLPTSVSVPVASESTTAAPADKGADTITIEPTRTPVPLPADYSRSTSGVPIHELVKLAQWDENRLKLSNFIAGYIIAHGLNHPARIIDMDPEGYKDALPNNDVDIVLEADPEWAKPYADAGIIVVLKPLSTASPDTVVAVNASLWKRAPEVGRFLERYEWGRRPADRRVEEDQERTDRHYRCRCRSQRLQAPGGNVEELGGPRRRQRPFVPRWKTAKFGSVEGSRLGSSAPTR